MNGKKAVKRMAVALLGVSVAIAATGCDSMIKTDSEADMSRIIATVDITKTEQFSSGGKYEQYKSVVQQSNGNIYKRDLVSAFLSSGYSSVQNGATYKDTFNSLMETLVARKITVQYAMAYFLDEQDDTFTVSGYESYMQTQENELTKVESTKRTQILTIKYFLTDGGTAADDDNEYDRAVYTLKKAVNSSLDSSETSYIRSKTEDDDTIDGADTTTRSVPTNATTEKDDYYVKNYEIYTGYNTPDSCPGYEKQENSTTRSRVSAYNEFLTNLVNNGIVEADDIKTTDFLEVDYYYVELLAQLEQSLITKFSDVLNEKATEKLDDEYLKTRYNEMYAAQKKSYDADISNFESAIGSLSATSFVLYVPESVEDNTYGFVYNLLIPFSAHDSQTISAYKNIADGLTDKTAKKVQAQNDYYTARAKAATNVKPEDQRTSWFSNTSSSNYAEYDEDAGVWKFFTKYSDKTRYETATHYNSSYPFMGTVTTDEKGKITKIDSRINNDNFKNIDAFISYLEAQLTATTNLSVSGAKSSTYKTTGFSVNDDYEYDYSDFLYYTGKVNGLGTVSLNDYFVGGSEQYNAVTVVNEFIFAFGTDTGAINSYIGYTVTPDCEETYVQEFAYAAKQAVKGGAGTYTVCLTDYGWHIMYCNYSYTSGSVYGDAETIFSSTYKDANGEYKADTFAKYFYESLKSAAEDENSEIVQERLLTDYKTDTAVKYYKARYQDLLDMDN